MSSKSSTTESADSELILVGLIHKPHGLRGEVAVEVLSDVAGRFAVGEEFLLSVPGVPQRTVRVGSLRPHGRGILVGFEGVATRDAAEALRAGRLEVERSQVPPAAAGEYYHFELTGCRCWAGESDLGEVVEVLEDGGGVLLSIENGGESLLVPFVEKFLVNVDIAGKRIDLDLPAGLVEACRSRS